MIVSADKEMRFYRSQDLKKWDYVSAFGRATEHAPTSLSAPTSSSSLTRRRARRSG